MASFSLDSLKSILRDDVGVPESADLDGEILDVPFNDLGYDSLALLQITVAIEQRHGVQLPEEAVSDMRTPRTAIEYVNGLLARS